MKGLSSEIEQSIEIILEGLDYEIPLSKKITDFEYIKDYIGCYVKIATTKNQKQRGTLTDVNRSELTINETIKVQEEGRYSPRKKSVEKTIKFVHIKDIEVYEDDSSVFDDDKMRNIVAAKVEPFKHAKEMLKKWANSANSPSNEKSKKYVERLVVAGEKSIEFLRQALTQNIDYDDLDVGKFASATKAKPLIIDGIFDLEYAIKELKLQLESDEFSFDDKEFRIGYPERFAKGEFYPKGSYHKNWYDKENDVVRICPFSSEGEIIELQNLKIQLPKKPDDSEILFHDLPKEEQYWKRQPTPNITPENVDMYHNYIMEEYRRRREGVWFMNNGNPVYLTGNMYFALQWCRMSDKGAYMDFRYAQLYLFYFLEACIVDNRSLGICFLKSRRTGFTYIILCILLNMSTSIRESLFGMTSMSDDDVEYTFAKYVYMLRNLPFWFTPVIKGKEDAMSSITFSRPSQNTKEAKRARSMNDDDYLNTTIDSQPTRENSYDSLAVTAILSDEAAKWSVNQNYVKHLGILSPTVMPNGVVKGKIFSGSTSASLKKGGMAFKEVYYGSDILKRDPITQNTVTALYSYFMPAHKNMEQFTDIYGVCHEDAPKEETISILGKKIEMGSIDYLKAKRNAKKDQNDKLYSEELRAYPMTEEEAFRDESGESVFNLIKLYDQQHHNAILGREGEHFLYKVGNFEWVNGVLDSDVYFEPTPKGRFKVSWMPSIIDNTEKLKNAVKEINGIFYPMNEGLGAAGCDPFSHKSTHGKGSKGAIHGLTGNLPIEGAPANRFIFEYCARPSDEEIFFEDVIKVIRFYGIPILVENNRPDLLRHMRNRGYRRFCLNRVDRKSGDLNAHEKEYGGQPMSDKGIIDSHMNAIGAWINNYVGVSTKEEIRPLGEMGIMPFEETLNDWITFNPEKRERHDLTISSGLAIMAVHKERFIKTNKEEKPFNLQAVLKRYDNSGMVGVPISNRSPLGKTIPIKQAV